MIVLLYIVYIGEYIDNYIDEYIDGYIDDLKKHIQRLSEGGFVF